MWSCRVLLVFVYIVVGASSSSSAWKPGAVYKYHAEARTLTALHQVADLYAGILVTGELELRPTSKNILVAKLIQPKYASIQTKLPGGWNSHIPERYLNMKPLPLSGKPFEIVLQDGLVAGLVVSNNIPTWELNILKSVASQLQLNTEGKDLVPGSQNAKPNHTAISPNAVFRAMEDSVTGKCEVLYDIAPLPPYLALAQPHLAPLVKDVLNTPIIEIVKTQNYSNCDRRIAFNFGFPGSIESPHPDGNHINELMARSSVSRVIIFGSLLRYTLQSVMSTSKVILSVLPSSNQKSMVVSSYSLNLVSQDKDYEAPQPVTNPKNINELGYSYENAYNYKPTTDRTQSAASKSSSSSSSSSSSQASSSMISNEDSASLSRSSTKEKLSSAIRMSSEEENESNIGSVSSAWRSKNKNSENESQRSISDSKISHRWFSESQEDGEKTLYGGMRLRRAINIREKFWHDSRSVSFENAEDEMSTSLPASGEWLVSESSEKNATSGTGRVWGIKSGSSEESTYLPLPSLTEPPSLPMLPIFAGISGKSISQKINIVEYVKKISLEIASDARNQNFMVKQNSLAKFAILTDVVRTMSTKQLQSVTTSLYYSKSSSAASESQNIRLFGWRIFRDAVAESGTSPALIALKDWILNSKVDSEEAAELIAALPSSAMMPNGKYLHEFFKLLSSPKVNQQQHLNVSALLAFTKLIRTSQIDNSTVHKYYPVHVYGRPASRRDTAVQEIYIPQLKKRLEEAFSQNDSVKIQVYTIAIGAIGHPIILKIFEPYLERKVNASTFQRTLMVISMSNLAKLYPEVARPVLFKIYQNTAESHELRCAAVLILLTTNPPRVMLQRMAEFTNYDPHMHVNAAVKSGIESLAGLQGSAHREISLAAKSAVYMLNSYTRSMQSTMNYMKSYESQINPLAFTHIVSYIGSDDSIVPKAIYYNSTRNFGGYKHSHFTFGAMTSSVASLIELLRTQTRSRQRNYGSGSESEETSVESGPQDWDTNFTPAHITRLLGLRLNKSEPVEGNVVFKFAGVSRLFTFDGHTIEKIPQVAQDVMEALNSERSFNFTKFFNQFSATLAFPVTTGLPFVYTIRTPSVISIGGKARIRTELDEQSSSILPKAVNATGQLDIWYSSQLQAELGFVTPFDNTHYISGVNQDVLLNLPSRAKVDIDVKNTEIVLKAQPIHKEENVTIFHYSTTPFTVRHNILNLKPLQEENSYELIIDKDLNQMKSTFGEKSIGMPFDVHYNVSGNVKTLWSIVEEARREPLMLLYFPHAEESVRYTNLTFTYAPHRSSASSVIVRGAFGSRYNSSKYEEFSSTEDRSFYHLKYKRSKSSFSLMPLSNSQRRVSEFLERASSGITNSSAVAVDFTVEFPGERNAEFVTTAALARSPVDENTRIVASVYSKPASELEEPQQICFDMSSKIPYVPLLNYKEALKASPYLSADISLKIGETCSAGSHITAQAKFSQSKERKMYISRHPMAELCERQMSEGNNALPACRNVSAEANYMDQLDIHVKYNNIPSVLKNITYSSYSALEYLLYPYIDEDVFIESPIQNQIKLKWKLSPDLKEWNVLLESPMVNAKLEHVPLGPISGPLLAVHPVYSAAERLSRVLLGDQYNPKCTIGSSAVNTFDNTTYPVFMGKCWHAMLKLAPKLSHETGGKYLDKYNDIAVLVRDSGSLKKDVKLITDNDIIDLTPSSSHQAEERGYASGKVRVNGVYLRISSKNVTYIYNENGSVWVEIFNLPSGEINLQYPLHGIGILYDGQTIQLSAKNYYRDNIRGLCGTFNGDTSLDLITPFGLLMTNPQLFSASYSFADDCQGPVPSIRRKAVQQGIVRPNDEFVAVNLINDEEIWGGFSSRSSSSSSSHHSDEDLSDSSQENLHRTQSSKIPTVFRTKVVVDGSQICFSVHPLPACSPDSHATARVQKNIPVFCISSSNPTAKKLRSMVESGANPDLRRKGASKYLRVSLPKECARD